MLELSGSWRFSRGLGGRLWVGRARTTLLQMTCNPYGYRYQSFTICLSWQSCRMRYDCFGTLFAQIACGPPAAAEQLPQSQAHIFRSLWVLCWGAHVGQGVHLDYQNAPPCCYPNSCALSRALCNVRRSEGPPRRT